METIKSFTSMKQSMALSEILPIESADMCYRAEVYNPDGTPDDYKPQCFVGTLENDIPCWSLAALFSILTKYMGGVFGKCLHYDMEHYYYGYVVEGNFITSMVETRANNPIDACYKMIINLHEIELL